MRTADLPARSLLLIAALSLGMPVLAAETTITQTHKTFDPDVITVQAGDVLHFENDDDVKHNIQVTDANDVTQDLGLQKPGETVTQAFQAPGEYRVHCSIHPKMRLRVLVQ